jgi:hypothetical protein
MHYIIFLIGDLSTCAKRAINNRGYFRHRRTGRHIDNIAKFIRQSFIGGAGQPCHYTKYAVFDLATDIQQFQTRLPKQYYTKLIIYFQILFTNPFYHPNPHIAPSG